MCAHKEFDAEAVPAARRDSSAPPIFSTLRTISAIRRAQAKKSNRKLQLLECDLTRPESATSLFLIANPTRVRVPREYRDRGTCFSNPASCRGPRRAPARHLSRNAREFLIANQNIRTPLNPYRISHFIFSNREFFEGVGMCRRPENRRFAPSDSSLIFSARRAGQGKHFVTLSRRRSGVAAGGERVFHAHVWRVGDSQRAAGVASAESGYHRKRSSYVGSRTGCGEVVQCFQGLWVHSAAIGRRRFRALLRDTDGRLQVAERRAACGVRGKARPEGLSGGKRNEGLACGRLIPSLSDEARPLASRFARPTNARNALRVRALGFGGFSILPGALCACDEKRILRAGKSARREAQTTRAFFAGLKSRAFTCRFAGSVGHFDSLRSQGARGVLALGECDTIFFRTLLEVLFWHSIFPGKN
jgi:hypothetical protein